MIAVILAFSAGAIIGLAIWGIRGILGGIAFAFVSILLIGFVNRLWNRGALPKEWRRNVALSFIRRNGDTIGMSLPNESESAVLAKVESLMESIFAQILKNTGELDFEISATPAAIHAATLSVAQQSGDPRMNVLLADLSLHLKQAMYESINQPAQR